MNVKVKLLRWETPFEAYGLGICYRISEGTPGEFGFSSPFYNDGPFTIDEAHKFAQSHFEALVNSVIIHD
jgi:DNA helicase HerA-like ATPase